MKTIYQIMQQRNKQEFYEVKELLDLVTEDGKEYCLVWWKNFPKSEATWEPIQNMTFMEKWDKHYNLLKQKIINRNQNLDEESVQSQEDVASVEEPKVTKTRRIKKWREMRETREQTKLLPKRNVKTNRMRRIQRFERIKTRRRQMMEKQNSQKLQNKQEKLEDSIFDQQSSSSSQQVQESIQMPMRMREQPQIVQSKTLRKQRKSSAKEYRQDGPSNTKRKPIQNEEIKTVKYKGSNMKLRPMTIDLQIVESKVKPFEFEEVERVKGSVMRSGEMMYDVEFKNDSMKESIILHNKYLKLLWPRKLAEFLIQKMKNDSDNQA